MGQVIIYVDDELAEQVTAFYCLRPLGHFLLLSDNGKIIPNAFGDGRISRFLTNVFYLNSGMIFRASTLICHPRN